MKSTYRKIMPHDNAQEFVSIINRMKTCGTAHVVNKRIYIEYSQRLKTLKSLQEISALLSEMLSLNVFPNTVIINQLINKMNQLKQINSAMELHRIAAERHIADAITYNSTICAIAKSATPDVNRAVSLFDDAKRLGFADAITYNSTIGAIAKSATPDVNRAVSLFDDAKRLGFADAITYNSTITAIVKSATPDVNRAVSLFDDAKRLGFADAITYASTIT